MKRKVLVSSCLSWIIFSGMVACSSGGGGYSDGGSSSSSSSSSSGSTVQDITFTANFSSIQSELFSTTCAVSGCHTGSNPPQGLNLSASQSYGLLVDVASMEVPSLDRVEPGNPDNSYLIRKLEGTATVGLRMPRNGPPYLTSAQIAVIRQWISDGAVDDRITMISTAGMAKPAQIVAVNPQPNAVLETSPAYVTIALNQALDASLINSNFVKVFASGGDGSFDDGNEKAVAPVLVSLSANNPGLIKIDLSHAELKTDHYRINISGNDGIAIASVSGVPIDGNGDGVSGGNFISEFTVLSDSK